MNAHWMLWSGSESICVTVLALLALSSYSAPVEHEWDPNPLVLTEDELWANGNERAKRAVVICARCGAKRISIPIDIESAGSGPWPWAIEPPAECRRRR